MYRPIRILHLYVGLFLSPFLVIYAVSAVVFNHTWVPSADRAASQERSVVLERIPEHENSLEQARALLRQVGESGEIAWVRRNEEEIRIRVERPGLFSDVRVDLPKETATVRTTDQGLTRAFLYLHRMPGPHLVDIRRNWFMMRAWGWLADATVYGLLFLTASGVYLWWVLRSERRAGLIAFGLGSVTFWALIAVLVA